MEPLVRVPGPGREVFEEVLAASGAEQAAVLPRVGLSAWRRLYLFFLRRVYSLVDPALVLRAKAGSGVVEAPGPDGSPVRLRVDYTAADVVEALSVHSVLEDRAARRTLVEDVVAAAEALRPRLERILASRGVSWDEFVRDLRGRVEAGIKRYLDMSSRYDPVAVHVYLRDRGDIHTSWLLLVAGEAARAMLAVKARQHYWKGVEEPVREVLRRVYKEGMDLEMVVDVARAVVTGEAHVWGVAKAARARREALYLDLASLVRALRPLDYSAMAHRLDAVHFDVFSLMLVGHTARMGTGRRREHGGRGKLLESL